MLSYWGRFKGLACCRYGNEPHAELQIAAAEQMAITELRLRKLLEARQQGAEAGPPSSTGGPLETVARRAGQLRAHIGAAHNSALLGCTVVPFVVRLSGLTDFFPRYTMHNLIRMRGTACKPTSQSAHGGE